MANLDPEVWAERDCEICGAHFAYRRSENARSTGTGRRFCSKRCRGQLSGHTHFNAKAEPSVCTKGYRWIRVPEGERGVVPPRHRLRIQEHIYRAQKALGRPLKRSEVVHHINGDKADNRNNNLLICSRSYHLFLHARMSELYQREKFGSAA